MGSPIIWDPATASRTARAILPTDVAHAPGSIPPGALSVNSVVTGNIVDANVTDVKLADSYIKADGTRPFTGDQDFGGNRATGLATPTAGADAANKDYVDGTAFDSQEDEIAVVSNGQTSFTLSQSFKPGGLSDMYVNGIAYAEGTDYTISGTTLTWLDTPFTLQIGDSIVIKYQT